MAATEWKGRFFESDGEEAPVDFEPDHVVTVSELTGRLPLMMETVETSQERTLAPVEKEAEDYRQLLAEVRRPYHPAEEKRLSFGLQFLLCLLALGGSAAGGLLFSFGILMMKQIPFLFPAFLPAAVSGGLFLLFTFFYFCTKGKTEKLLMFLLLLAGAAAFMTAILPY